MQAEGERLVERARLAELARGLLADRGIQARQLAVEQLVGIQPGLRMEHRLTLESVRLGGESQDLVGDREAVRVEDQPPVADRLLGAIQQDLLLDAIGDRVGHPVHHGVLGVLDELDRLPVVRQGQLVVAVGGVGLGAGEVDLHPRLRGWVPGEDGAEPSDRLLEVAFASIDLGQGSLGQQPVLVAVGQPVEGVLEGLPGGDLVTAGQPEPTVGRLDPPVPILHDERGLGLVLTSLESADGTHQSFQPEVVVTRGQAEPRGLDHRPRGILHVGRVPGGVDVEVTDELVAQVRITALGSLDEHAQHAAADVVGFRRIHAVGTREERLEGGIVVAQGGEGGGPPGLLLGTERHAQRLRLLVERQHALVVSGDAGAAGLEIRLAEAESGVVLDGDP